MDEQIWENYLLWLKSSVCNPSIDASDPSSTFWSTLPSNFKLTIFRKPDKSATDRVSTKLLLKSRLLVVCGVSLGTDVRFTPIHVTWLVPFGHAHTAGHASIVITRNVWISRNFRSRAIKMVSIANIVQSFLQCYFKVFISIRRHLVFFTWTYPNYLIV